VGIEVDDRHPAPPHVPGHAGHVGQRNGVVTPQHDGDGTRSGDSGHCLLQPGDRKIGVAGVHLDVADIDHTELDQRIHPEGQMGSRAVLGQVVGGPYGKRPEPATGPVAGSAVEGRTDDHRPGLRKTGRIIEIGRGDAGEGGVRPVHVPQSHRFSSVLGGPSRRRP
jgi:hypothetical protein